MVKSSAGTGQRSSTPINSPTSAMVAAVVAGTIRSTMEFGKVT